MNRESQEGRRTTTEGNRSRIEETELPRARRASGTKSDQPTPEKEEVKDATEQAVSGEKPYKRLPLIVRIPLWILRKSIVPLLLVLALVGGAFLGYVMLGEGDRSDVFKWETWRHLYDLIFLDS